MIYQTFFQELLNTIKENDPLHYKRIAAHVEQYFTLPTPRGQKEFEDLCKLTMLYCNDTGITPIKLAQYYLQMIADVRFESINFFRTGEYSCKNQAEANEKVYSNKEVMTYYMYALLVSQVLWKHHFDVFMYLKNRIGGFIEPGKSLKILDVGPGHGFFSYLIKDMYPAYNCLDIVDISEHSLKMTKKMLGNEDCIHYINIDIFNFKSESKYDLIVLGEVMEHLDNPRFILTKLSELLNSEGFLWITVPTNAPAIDHVYLFKSRTDVINLIEDSGLKVIDSAVFCTEGMDENTANKRKITTMVALFAQKAIMK